MSPRKAKWTATEVIDALRSAYGLDSSGLVTEEWAILTEVPLRGSDGRWGDQRTIDVFMVRNWASGIGHRRIAVEVKVSRSDYRNETPVKRYPAELAAHQTYYAAPAGIIDPVTLPRGWGLIEVYRTREERDAGKGWDLGAFNSRCKVRTRPVERTPGCNMDYLVSAGFRRASRAEERIRRGEDDVALVPALRETVERLEGQLRRREETLQRERERHGQWRSMALAVDGMQDCADCGQRVGFNHHRGTWRHMDAEQERRCYAAREEVNRVAREEQFGARYLRGWAGPVEPKALREAREALPDEATLDG